MKLRKSFFIFVLLSVLFAFFRSYAQENKTDAIPQSVAECGEPASTDPVDNSTSLQTPPYIPPQRSTRLIIGTDDRTTISNPSEYPYSAISFLIVTAKCGCKWSGSGFMVGPRTMMTAAHCLVCTDHGKTADSVTAYFGYKSSKDYLYKYDVKATFWYSTDFSNPDGTYSYSPHTQSDSAYLKLDEDIGFQVGWFGLAVRSNQQLLNQSYELAGYRDGLLKSDRETGLVKVTSSLIIHSIDMLPGNSGCPLFDDEYYVIAINIAENESLQANIGLRITQELIDNMRSENLL